MAARRKAKPRTRKKFRGINVLNTAVDFYQADQAVSIFTNQGIIGTFIEPFLNPASGGTYGGIYRAGGSDNALDIKEMWKWATDPAAFQATLAGGGAHWVTGSIDWKTKLSDLTLGKVVMANVTSNAVPAMIRIGLSGVAKKIVRKSGVTRSMNKLTRAVGMSDLVRW